MRFLKEKVNISSLIDGSTEDVADACESSLALGQHKNGVSLKGLVAAYTIFDDGVYKKPRSYYKVTDAEGNIILDNCADGERAISSESASIMVQLLKTVVIDGTAQGKISLDGIEVAGKTGTTTNACDKYFIGLTPSIVAGCWTGYEMPKRINMKNNPSVSIWNEVMSKIYEQGEYKNAKKKFDIPDGVVSLTYDIDTGEAPNFDTDEKNLRVGWFKK